jgi:pheromone shutdown protein TraB
MKYQNLTLIGTSHIAKESIDEIKKQFSTLNPDIVAIELDKNRLYGLLNKKDKSKKRNSLFLIPKIGLKGYIFSLMGEWAEKKLGESVGVSPGEDMLIAFRLAKKHSKKVALIDQEIEITLKRLSKTISWKEKWNFLVDIFKAVILRKPEIGGFDLKTVPSHKLIEKMLKKVKKRYPNIYHVLVTERNTVMAKNLAVIMKQNPEKMILAMIGAGHEKEMMDIIKKRICQIEIVYSSNYTVDV